MKDLTDKMQRVIETTELPEHKAVMDRWITLACESLIVKHKVQRFWVAIWLHHLYPSCLGEFVRRNKPIIQKS